MLLVLQSMSNNLRSGDASTSTYVRYLGKSVAEPEATTSALSHQSSNSRANLYMYEYRYRVSDRLARVYAQVSQDGQVPRTRPRAFASTGRRGPRYARDSALAGGRGAATSHHIMQEAALPTRIGPELAGWHIHPPLIRGWCFMDAYEYLHLCGRWYEYKYVQIYAVQGGLLVDTTGYRQGCCCDAHDRGWLADGGNWCASTYSYLYL